ncbi:MAG: tetratricopeptide repeat protein, partial [Anaerovoracaceae bacterium]
QDCNDCISIYGGDIEAFFCKINILIEVGEIQDALQELDDLEAQVQGTKITFLRGKAHEAAGDLEQAKDAYLKVLDINGDMQRDPFYPAELDDLTGTYFRLYHTLQKLYRETEKGQYWHDSMKYLREGVKLYPDDLPLVSELAGELYGQSRHGEAQELYRKMTKLDPSGRHFAQLAGNEIQMDRFADAEAHLLRAAELEPDLTYTSILFGALYTHTGRYPEALSALSRAQDLAVRKEEAWYRILRDKAMVYCRMQDYDHAEKCLRENFRLYQQQEDVSTLMEVLRMAGRFNEAIAEGERYLEAHEAGDSLMVLEELKSAAMYLRDTDRFIRYTSLETSAYTAVYQCGRLYMYMNGEENRAVDFFEKAVSLRKNDINANIDLAKLYLKLKNKKKAAECAGRVLDAIPKDFMDYGYNRAYYLVRSAEALAILGKNKEALDRLQLAMDGRKCDFCKYSGCIDAYCALVYISSLQGDKDAMQHWLQEGLAVSPYDYDLKNLSDAFFAKKTGLFTKKRGLFQ